MKWGEGTGQRLGLAGVRRRVRSPRRLPCLGVSLEAAAGLGQGLVIKEQHMAAPSAMTLAGGGGTCSWGSEKRVAMMKVVPSPPQVLPLAPGLP